MEFCSKPLICSSNCSNFFLLRDFSNLTMTLRINTTSNVIASEKIRMLSIYVFSFRIGKIFLFSTTLTYTSEFLVFIINVSIFFPSLLYTRMVGTSNKLNKFNSYSSKHRKFTKILYQLTIINRFIVGICYKYCRQGLSHNYSLGFI